MDNAQIKEHLCHAFCTDISIRELKNGTLNVSIPMIGRDGDNFSIYLTQKNSVWRVSDGANTMMRLSYENDLNKLLTGSRLKLYQNILSESELQDDDGELFLEAASDELIRAIFNLGQGITRIEDLSLWTTNRVASTFYDDLSSLIRTSFDQRIVTPDYFVPDLDDAQNYPIDYCFKTHSKPFYLFGVANKDKARLTTITLQHLLKHSPHFDSMVVFEDMENIPRQDQHRLMAVANDIAPNMHNPDSIIKKIEHRLSA